MLRLMVQSLASLGYWVTRPSAQLRTRRVTTTECAFAISRHDLPEVCYQLPALFVRGRREDRVLAAPAVSRAICANKKCTRAYRAAGNTPAFPAQWLYGLLRALPGERLFCLRRPRKLAFANLTPAPRRPNHTTSPYAQAAHVSRSSRVHRISPRVRDDGQRPSSAVRRAELCR
jgi:hypothetical protein